MKRLIRLLLTPRGQRADLWLVRLSGRSLLNELMARRQGFRPQPMLVLRSRGARSGRWREAALPYFTFGETLVVVGSKGGAPDDPAWVANLRLHPEAEAVAGGRRRPVRARIAEGDERTALWTHIVAEMAVYARYQARTDREIPVVLLEEPR
jgi:deazaflavin-dependent oxidoreductase (nitroreductase family)